MKGMPVGNKTFKVHLDGYDVRDALAGRAPSPRREFFYFNDDGSLVAMRYEQWKIVFAEQRAHSLDVWQDPIIPLRFPKLFNVRSDPFESADHEASTTNVRASSTPSSSCRRSSSSDSSSIQGVSAQSAARQLQHRCGAGGAPARGAGWKPVARSAAGKPGRA